MNIKQIFKQLITVSLLFSGSLVSAAVVTESCTDCPVAVLDNTTQTSVLNVATTGTILDLDVSFDMTHTWDSDIIVTLEHVDTATSVVLSNGNGGSANNYVGTIFDDEAAVAIGAGVAPFTGSFIPDNPLAAFDGDDLSGVWNLHLEDTAGGDEGTLDAWSLIATTLGVVVIAPTTGLITTEAGGTASFIVSLSDQPTADVTIPLSSNDTSECIVAASVLVPVASWDTGVSVTVSGVNDTITDGDQPCSIETGLSTSADASYNGIDPADVSVTNRDRGNINILLMLPGIFGSNTK